MSYGTRPMTAAEKVHEDLQAVASRHRLIAHDERNHFRLRKTEDGNYRMDDHRTRQVWIPVEDGEEGEEELAPASKVLQHTQRLDSWETRVSYAYSVDVRPENGGGEVAWRHLSVTIRVPGVVRQGELNLPLPGSDVTVKASLLPLVEPILLLYFPLAEQVRFNIRALPPVPVGDPRTGQASYVTPVVVHVLVRHDGSDEVKPGTKVQLFGPDGNPV